MKKLIKKIVLWAFEGNAVHSDISSVISADGIELKSTTLSLKGVSKLDDLRVTLSDLVSDVETLKNTATENSDVVKLKGNYAIVLKETNLPVLAVSVYLNKKTKALKFLLQED